MLLLVRDLEGKGGLRGSLNDDDGSDAVSIAASIRRERERERERDRSTEYLQQCDRERRFRDEREDDDRISVHALEKYAPNLARSLNVGSIASSGVAGGSRRGVDDDEDARSVSSRKSCLSGASRGSRKQKKRMAGDSSDDEYIPEEATPKSAKKRKAPSSTPRTTKKAARTTAASPATPLPSADAPPFVETPNAVGPDGKTIEETYQRKTPLEHVLLRPDTYIGSVQTHVGPQWVWEQGRMVHREVRMVPGLYKIFDEILVNAADNKQRDPSMDAIKVTIDTAKNKIQVWNNGRGIPVEVHAKEGCYVPELIFGHLLTSSNYDDSARKTTGGRNGYGAKLANIFSTEFVVETADGSRQKKYKQVRGAGLTYILSIITSITFQLNLIFSQNMSVKKAPVIKDCKPTDNFTSITFHPDLAKFGLASLDADHVALMSRRVVDVAGCLGKSVKVMLNGTRVPVKSFADYAGLYLAPPPLPTPQPPATPPSSGEGGSGGEGGEGTGAEGGVSAAEATAAVAAAAAHPSTHEKLPSFVNAIATTRGGTHVNMVSEQIVRYLLDKAQKKAATGKHGSASGAAAIKPHQVRLWSGGKERTLCVACWFINCQVVLRRPFALPSRPSLSPSQMRSQLCVPVNCLVVQLRRLKALPSRLPLPLSFSPSSAWLCGVKRLIIV
ncbi:unnamed protein product [Closterium sp. Yama58-4]|nr:unnamed protein product [Closterium sp. Yama58-4]